MRPVNLLFVGLLLIFVTKVAPHQSCPPGKKEINSKCEDEDECEEGGGCGENANCFNTNGSFYCTCVPGYRTKSKKVNFTLEECRDINECIDDKSICGSNAVCNNNIGSYYCTCASGFHSSNGQKIFNASQGVTCKDIDECKNETICGPNAKCNNTIGSFNCMCNSGFKSSNGQKANQGVKCEDVCTDGASLCGEGGVCITAENIHECECKAGFTNYGFKNMSCTKLECDSLLNENISAQIPEQLKRIVPELQSSCAKLNSDTSGDSRHLGPQKLLEMLLGAIDDLLSDEPMNTNEKVTAFFEIIENALKIIGPVLVRHCNRSTHHTQLEILISRGAASPQAPLTMYTDNVQLNSHWETAAGDKYLGFATVALLSYRGLNKSVNGYFDWIDSQENQRIQINSEVVTISVTNPKPIHLEKPVILTFSHLQHQPPEANVSCAFWDSSLGGGAWSTSGCTLVKSNCSHTVCSCTHLSSFAVLMALYEQENVFELQLITWVGLSLSMICLLICILTFHFVHSIKSTRTTIHLHLCISLFIADLIFLAGISQTENKVGCAFVAGMLHFFFLAVFCWMLLEGLQLFRMVVLVFNTTVNSYYLMAAGYGVPALIVTISAIINAKGYGTTRHCWLNLENGFIWSFFGPVCVIIVVNVFFFLITVWKLAEKFSSLNPDFNKLRKLKTFTITAIAQLCVLGTMWIFGCFQFDESTLVMSYIFTILNSLQGVLVFLMHCLLVKQVREVYANSLWKMCRPQKRKYDEFSTNQSSKSQGSKSSHNTGESHI